MSENFQFPFDKVLNPDPSNSPVRISSYFDWSLFSDFLKKGKRNQTNEAGIRIRKRRKLKSLSVGSSPLVYQKEPNFKDISNCTIDSCFEVNFSKKRGSSLPLPFGSYLSSQTNNKIEVLKKDFGTTKERIFPGNEGADSNKSAFEKSSETFQTPGSSELSPLSPFKNEDYSRQSSQSLKTDSQVLNDTSFNFSKADPDKAISGKNTSGFPTVSHNGIIELTYPQNEVSFRKSALDLTTDPSFSSLHTGVDEAGFFSSSPQANQFIKIEENSNKRQSCSVDHSGHSIELIQALLKLSSHRSDEPHENPLFSSDSQSSSNHKSALPSALDILSYAAMKKKPLREDCQSNSNGNSTKTIHSDSSDHTVKISHSEATRLVALKTLVSQVDEMTLMEFLLKQ